MAYGRSAVSGLRPGPALGPWVSGHGPDSEGHETAEGSICLSGVRGTGAEVGRALCRLRRLELDGRGTAGGAGVTSLQGVTRSVEYLGSTVQVGIDVTGLETLSATLSEARFDASPVRPGEPVILSWKPEDVHVLGR